MSLVSDRDVLSMYQKAKKDDMFLWVEVSACDSDDDHAPVRKKRRKEKEDEVEDIFDELKSMHKSDFTSPQLKLWAKMLYCGTHDKYDEPPKVPMITGSIPTHSKKESFTQALTGAAGAVVKALTPSPKSVPSSVTGSSCGHSANIRISPGKSTQLRMQNLQQLRVLQQLYYVLFDSELAEQKGIILDTLRRLK